LEQARGVLNYEAVPRTDVFWWSEAVKVAAQVVCCVAGVDVYP
jgi:hypothetical protein